MCRSSVVCKRIINGAMVVVFTLINNHLSLCLSRSLAGVEAELLSEAAPVVIWRLVETIEKHGEKTRALMWS